MKPASSLISRWANFGYDRDAWQASLLDIVGFISDPSNPNTPLPEVGMACIVGRSPTGEFARYSYGDIVIHSSDPNELFVKKPAEVRVVIDRSSGELWLWDFGNQHWYSIGRVSSVEGVTLSIPLTEQIINQKKIELSRPVLDPPPRVYLTGCGDLHMDVNFWMSDTKTITFDPDAGPDSLANFPLRADMDILRIRYMTPGLPKIH